MNLSHATHAQFGEDRRLLEIFGDMPPGVCVEVGAFDGVAGSATLAFEQRGWTTILVEPLPELAAKIRRNRTGRVFEAAAGPANTDVIFKRAMHDAAISTLADTAQQRAFFALRGETWEEITVRQLTLDTILGESAVTRVDFATIDVEGFELEVLRGWDLARWQPRVIILEDNSRGLDLRVAAHLEAAGYVCFHHTGVNDWYTRTTDRALATPAACRRQWLRRRLRRLRQWSKGLAPKPLIGLLRRSGLAGE